MKTLLVVGALALVFYAGVYTGRDTAEPRVTAGARANIDTGISPNVASRLVATHTVQYIDRPVTVVDDIKRVERVPVEVRNFNDLEELERWLAWAATNTTTIYFQLPDDIVDCDDYALTLQQKALADGYLMSLEIIGSAEYNGVFQDSILPADSLHAINLVILGNDAYYIEPQTGEVAFAAHLD